MTHETKHPAHRLYRYSDGNTYTDNLSLAAARRFKKLQNGGTITPMEDVVSETKHTPGPWQLYQPAARSIYVQAGENVCICKLAESGDYEANARLIAAAPELLEACHDALCVAPEGGEVERRLLAAIAKAEGR